MQTVNLLPSGATRATPGTVAGVAATASSRAAAGTAGFRPSLPDTLKRHSLAENALLVFSTDDQFDTFEPRELPWKAKGFRLITGRVDSGFAIVLPDLLAITARIAPSVRVIVAPRIGLLDTRLDRVRADNRPAWREVSGAMLRLSVVLPTTSFAQIVPHIVLSSALSAAEAPRELFRQLWAVMETLLSDGCLDQISADLDLHAHASATEMVVSEAHRRATAFALYAESDRHGVGTLDEGFAAECFADALRGDLAKLHC